MRRCPEHILDDIEIDVEDDISMYDTVEITKQEIFWAKLKKFLTTVKKYVMLKA